MTGTLRWKGRSPQLQANGSTENDEIVEADTRDEPALRSRDPARGPPDGARDIGQSESGCKAGATHLRAD